MLWRSRHSIVLLYLGIEQRDAEYIMLHSWFLGTYEELKHIPCFYMASSAIVSRTYEVKLAQGCRLLFRSLF